MTVATKERSVKAKRATATTKAGSNVRMVFALTKLYYVTGKTTVEITAMKINVVSINILASF